MTVAAEADRAKDAAAGLRSSAPGAPLLRRLVARDVCVPDRHLRTPSNRAALLAGLRFRSVRWSVSAPDFEV